MSASFRKKCAVTRTQVMQALEECNGDDFPGFCLSCGVQCEGVDPDTRGDTCDECKQPTLWGAEAILEA